MRLNLFIRFFVFLALLSKPIYHYNLALSLQENRIKVKEEEGLGCQMCRMGISTLEKIFTGDLCMS